MQAIKQLLRLSVLVSTFSLAAVLCLGCDDDDESSSSLCEDGCELFQECSSHFSSQYSSVDECTADCEQQSGGACSSQHTELQKCVNSLSCQDYLIYESGGGKCKPKLDAFVACIT
ncbi:MAG: hypothetical protein GY847_41505 [Proteobacteria bacterium]|nr:hypothetical protein [Pseudomonadota bacterium]